MKLTHYTFQYIQLLSTVTVIKIIGVIIAIALYPFLERHIWNIMQDTVDECDVTSVAYYAIAYVQMSVRVCIFSLSDGRNFVHYVLGCIEQDT